jgi:hypothetical protein
MRKSDIARLVEKGFGTVGNALAAYPQFSRVDVDRYALTEWEGEPYDGVVEQVKAAIKRRGGVASLDDIIADVTGQYSVARTSVTAYLGTHHFVKVSRGMYRVRGSSEKTTAETRATLESTSTCFMVDGRWALRLIINDDRLRGSGVGIPWAFAHQIGLTPGSHFDVSVVASKGRQDLGLARFGWPKNMPTMGSVATVATALGMKLGDYLFLAWDPSSRRLVAYGTRGVRSHELNEDTNRAKIAALIGLSPTPSETPKLLERLAAALGLGSDAGRGLVIGRLTSRGDDELVKLSRVLYDLEALRAI